MKKVRVFDIEWETDGESPDLPSEVIVISPEEDVHTGGLLSYLSDSYGWLVLDMKWEIVKD